MHGLSPIDPGRRIDWGRTSSDYALHRSGPPASFYDRLAALGIGLAGQRILDLGTGTGAIARALAARGARVCGIDIAPEQVAAARALADAAGLTVEFRVAAAERVPYPEGSFEVITANQCWLYFDKTRAIAEARRLLVKGGALVTSHFSWLPRVDPVARATEALVLKHNPQWTAADWSGEIPACPAWASESFNVRATFYYDEPIPFTREEWRGRIRACRGVGASLSAEEAKRFDAEHEELLRSTAPERFAVLHRIDAHVFEFKDPSERT